MTFDDILNNVRRLVEDEASFRWTDKNIAEYIVEAVNEVYRKTGGTVDTVPYDLVSGTSQYEITNASAGDGRVISVRLLPENSVETITLQQVQVADLPVDFSTDQDPTHYALSQVNESGTLGARQWILFNYQPNRTTTSSPYGFFVDFAREFYVDTSDANNFNQSTGVADATLLDDDIPLLPKFDRHVTNMVAGQLMVEQNDASSVQKGQFLIETAKNYIADISYVDSISKYVWQPSRPFP